jgi:hypothetical protein
LGKQICLSKALRKLWQLPREQRVLLARAALWLAIVRIALWVAPFRRVWSWFGATRQMGPRRPKDQTDIAKMRWAVDAAARHLPRATCLVRALTLRHLLHQEGIAAQVRIGVTRSETPTLRAHAWVEVEGVKLTSGEDLSAYRAFPDFQWPG